MFHLPVDLIRHIYKMLLVQYPLSIFTFDEEMFKEGEYTNEEKTSLAIECINKYNKILNTHILASIDVSKPEFKTKFFLDILDLINVKVLHDNNNVYPNIYYSCIE